MLIEEPQYLMRVLKYHVDKVDDFRLHGEEKVLAYLLD
jgi:hypothetical protein